MLQERLRSLYPSVRSARQVMMMRSGLMNKAVFETIEAMKVE